MMKWLNIWRLLQMVVVWNDELHRLSLIHIPHSSLHLTTGGSFVLPLRQESYDAKTRR